MNRTFIQIQTDDFDVGTEYHSLCQSDAGAGAVVFFVGRVREKNLQGEVSQLELQHYPGMTEKLIGDICEKARQRWVLRAISVVHRIGSLNPGDQIVFVGCSSAHRADALNATHFIMDYLKTEATFWKKETRGDESEWLDQRSEDAAAREKWQS